jgi:hypothetical protein
VPQAPRPRIVSDEHAPFDFGPHEEPDALSVEDRQSLRSAAWWLKTAAGVGVVYTFTCGCVNTLAFGPQVASQARTAVILFVVRLIALGVMAAGADAIENRRSRALGLTGSILALLLSSYLVLLPGAVVLDLLGIVRGPARPPGDPSIVCVSLFSAVLVAGIGLVGGVRGLIVLNKPEVIRHFRRKR